MNSAAPVSSDPSCGLGESHWRTLPWLLNLLAVVTSLNRMEPTEVSNQPKESGNRIIVIIIIIIINCLMLSHSFWGVLLNYLTDIPVFTQHDYA